MKNKDSILLEKAYISMTQKIPSVPSDEKNDSETVDNVIAKHDLEDTMPSNVGADVSVEATPSEVSEEPSQISLSDLFSKTQENSNDDSIHDMNIDNLNSIRESIVKIASFCSSGCELEVWQQQNIAIAMDNLNEVARRLH